MTLTYGVGTNQQYHIVVSSRVNLVIHHRFHGIELVSPEYACDGADCYLTAEQRVNLGSKAYACFRTNFAKSEPIGILMYELKNTKQSNKNAMSSEDETKCIRLFIIWKINNAKEFCVYSHLIEHDKGHTWDRDKLMKLAKYYTPYNIHVPVELTYLMHDNTVLMKRVNVTHK
jgi:hypothetical protein